jgi:hypothetical protein
MEAAVKPILLDLMASKPLNAEQISLLLDWFDKIRVGLWLSELTLSKQVDSVKPKFHIADRVGQKDRMLIIDRIKDLGQGLAFVGTDSPMFIEMPSAFTLIVDDLSNLLKPDYSGERDAATESDRITTGQEVLRLNVTKCPVPHFEVGVEEYRRGNDVVKFATVPT